MTISRRSFLEASSAAALGAALSPRNSGAEPAIASDTAMRAVALAALEEADRRGSRYTETWVSEHRHESMLVDGFGAPTIQVEGSVGVGVRVLVGASWAFGSAPGLTLESARAAVRQALGDAQSGRSCAGPSAPRADVRSIAAVALGLADPETVLTHGMIELLRSASASAMAASQVERVSVGLVLERDSKTYADSAGNLVSQHFGRSWVPMTIIASGGGGRFGARRNPVPPTAGAPKMTVSALRGSAMERWAGHAVAIARAASVETGIYDLVLTASNVAALLEFLLVRSRRPLGAGDRPGPANLAVAADRRNLAMLSGCQVDDEGAIPDASAVIEQGIFVDRPWLRRVAGYASAPSWNTLPAPRVPDLWLAPNGTRGLSGLVSTVHSGLLVDGDPVLAIDRSQNVLRVRPQYTRVIRAGSLDGVAGQLEYEVPLDRVWASLVEIGAAESLEAWGRLWNASVGRCPGFSVVCPAAVLSGVRTRPVPHRA